MDEPPTDPTLQPPFSQQHAPPELPEAKTDQAGVPAAAAGEGGEPAAAAASPLRGRLATTVGSLLRNLGAGVRLALFLRVRPEGLAAAPGDLVLLTCTDLLLGFLAARALVGGEGTLSLAALPYLLFPLPLMLLLGLVAARLLGRPELAITLPVAFVALGIPLELSHGMLEGLLQVPRLRWLEEYLYADHYYRFFGWWLAAAGLFVLRLGPARWLRRATALAAFLLLLALPLWDVPRYDLWAADDGSAGEGPTLPESSFYAQQGLLETRLTELKPGRKGITDLYFIGFAGDGSQDVFMKELAVIEELVAARFDAAGRSLTLVNNPQTVTTRPFATATALARTLQRVGEVMNRDEDVLVLYLTSHGVKEHRLVISIGGLELAQLEPMALRRMLDEAGIRWRVVVVSACFSGGFLDALKDDRTLVLTAADADRESFGCSAESDFTWFGKAYFDVALRESYSFTTAFARARQIIAQWEEEEGENPSAPQMFQGKEIGKKLAVLENRLAARGGARRQGLDDCPAGTVPATKR